MLQLFNTFCDNKEHLTKFMLMIIFANVMEATIEKLEKTIERVKKERDRNVKGIEDRVEDEKEMERMTAFFDEEMNYELRGIYREIKDTEEKLQKYIVQLDEEKVKESNRTVQVILDFLEIWECY